MAPSRTQSKQFGNQIWRCTTGIGGDFLFTACVNFSTMTLTFAHHFSDIASAQTAICKPSSCLITSKGIVSCIPPCTQAGRCFPKYDRWPYDQQNCTLHIGTWVNSGEEIDFNVLKTIINDDDLSSQDLQWKLIKATYKRNHGNFSATKQTYPSLTFSFLIERHSAEHGAAIMVPALSMPLNRIE